MRNATAAACVSAMTLAAALPCDAGIMGHWAAADVALAGIGLMSWLRRVDGNAFPAHLMTMPAMLVTTLAGLAQGPHCIVSVEAEAAGRAIAGGLAAWLAWMAVDVLIRDTRGDAREG